MLTRFNSFTMSYLVLHAFLKPTFVLANDIDNNDLGYKIGLSNIDANLKIGYFSNLYNASLFQESNINFLMSLDKGIYGTQGKYSYSILIPEGIQETTQSHSLGLSSYWSPLSSHFLHLSTVIMKTEEQIGTGLTSESINFENGPDSYDYIAIKGEYSFERLDQESITFSLSQEFNDKEYQSTRNTALNANLEQNSTAVSLGYKWSENKRIFIQTVSTQGKYPNITNLTKNSKNEVLSIGTIWPITQITDISFLYGKESKRFNTINKNLSTDYWSTTLSWLPLPYTNFTLEFLNKQQPIDKPNQTLNSSNDIILNWNYIKNSYSKIAITLKNNKTKETISGISKMKKSTFLSIKKTYKDFSFYAEIEKNSAVLTKSINKYIFSLNYNFKGEI